VFVATENEQHLSADLTAGSLEEALNRIIP